MRPGTVTFLILLSAAILDPVTRAAPIDAEQFHKDLSALCAPQSRLVGSPGYYDTAKYLESAIGKLPNVELKKHEFPVMVPVIQSANLDLGRGRVEKIYP